MHPQRIYDIAELILGTRVMKHLYDASLSAVVLNASGIRPSVAYLPRKWSQF